MAKGRAVHVEDSCHSLKVTRIPSANCINATAVNSHHHLHGGMTRPVHMCCPCRYPRLVASFPGVLGTGNEATPAGLILCRPCGDDVTRELANPCHVPRWRKGKTCTKSSNCCVLGCSSVTFAAGTTHQEQVQEAFERTGLKCSSDVIPTPTPLVDLSGADPGFIKGGSLICRAAAEGSAQRCEVLISPRKARKNLIAFIFQLSGWALVAPSCFALQVPDAGPGAVPCASVSCSNFAHTM